jgi:hypothetical protein
MEEIQYGLLDLDLQKLITDCEEIAGWWDGDLPGRAEDRAHIAADIIETTIRLQDLLKELNNT